MPHALTPGKPRTLDEFTAALRALKVDVGSPSITEITRRIHRAWERAGRPPNEWPARSTVGNCFLTGRRRPNSDLVMAVVESLVDRNVAVLDQWRQALRNVLGEAEVADCPLVSTRLPTDLRDFTGRETVLQRAKGLFAEHGGHTVVFEGMAGIGKTTLAVHLAHRLQRQGLVDHEVLAVDLHGIDPHGPPTAPAAVLESFLRLLGVPGDQIPPDLHVRAALYRRRLTGTRTLVFLDNAANVDQVSPLLPPATCSALITSRHTLTGLVGATNFPLGTFTSAEALQLLRRTARVRHLDADPESASKIVELLGCHPLALSIIGGHLHDHLNWTLTDYLEPLTTLAMEGGLRAALALSDRGLPPDAQRLLRLLALHPGHDFDAHAAAVLSNQTLITAQRQLDILLSAHLLERHGRKRYGFHDLVRAYATERVAIDEPMSRSRQAQSRLLEHYRRTAKAATLQISSDTKGQRFQRSTVTAHLFVSADEARQWLQTEQSNLCAVAALIEPAAVARPRPPAVLAASSR